LRKSIDNLYVKRIINPDERVEIISLSNGNKAFLYDPKGNDLKIEKGKPQTGFQLYLQVKVGYRF